MRWSFAVRVLEGIPVDRARERYTLTYALTERLSVGAEYNQRADDLGLLANWRVLDETESWPALILGTSSDRIGTPTGRAYFATLSKDLETWTGLPIAPYVGTAFGSFEDKWRLIGGLRVRWIEEWSSTHLWDGVNLHHTIDWVPEARYRLGLVAAEQDGKYFVGLSVGTNF